MPLFKLTIQGIDRTATVNDRLIDLTLTDKRGLEADELSLTLSDDDAALPLPSKGDKIQLWLATTTGHLIDKGTYTIDEAEHSGTPDQMSIKAKSADMKSKLKVKRSESHHDTTIGAIAAKVAKRHKLTLSIHKDAASIEIPHLDQTSESDMNLLTRIAQEHDLMASVKHGRLLIKPAGTGQTVSGKSLATLVITRQSGDQHRYSRADRDTDYDGASSSYHDSESGTEKTITVDADGKEIESSKPQVITKKAHSKKHAKAKAHAKAKQTARQKAEFSLVLATGRPEIIPEMHTEVRGFRPYIDVHKWQTVEVSHSISESSYQTSLKLETV